MKKQKPIFALSGEKLYNRQNSFYEKAYDTQNTPWSIDGKPDPFVIRQSKKVARRVKTKTALDLGCGDGRHSVFIHNIGFMVIGIEYQKRALRTAKRGKGKKPLYINGDIFRFPFKEGRFGLIIDYGVFHHIRRNDTGAYLGFISRMMARGGYYMLSCFGENFTHSDGKKYGRGFVLHKNHYDRFSSKKEIRAIFGKKFKITEINEDGKGILHVLMESRS